MSTVTKKDLMDFIMNLTEEQTRKLVDNLPLIVSALKEQNCFSNEELTEKQAS